MRVHVRPRFYFDIAREDLWLLDRAGADVADAWHESLWKSILFLEEHPYVGRERRDLKHKGIRSWRIKGFERWLISMRCATTSWSCTGSYRCTMNLSQIPFD